MRIEVLTVYKNSVGKQVAVEAQFCDNGNMVFESLESFIHNVITYGYEKVNFQIVDGDRLQGKCGVHLPFKELLTYSEIKHKYPETNVKLGRVLTHDNSIAGRILYASVDRVGTDREADLDEIDSWNKGIDVIWICTKKDKGRVRF